MSVRVFGTLKVELFVRTQTVLYFILLCLLSLFSNHILHVAEVAVIVLVVLGQHLVYQF